MVGGLAAEIRGSAGGVRDLAAGDRAVAAGMLGCFSRISSGTGRSSAILNQSRNNAGTLNADSHRDNLAMICL